MPTEVTIKQEMDKVMMEAKDKKVCALTARNTGRPKEKRETVWCLVSVIHAVEKETISQNIVKANTKARPRMN